MKFKTGRESLGNVKEIEEDRIFLGSTSGAYIEVKILKSAEGHPAVEVRSDRRIVIKPMVSNSITVEAMPED